MAQKAPQAAARVHAALRAAIVAREHMPGDMLSRPAIALSLGVSRTPVREAMDRLAAEGFVTVRPRAGTLVAPVDVQALHEGHFLRLALGRETVRRLARRPAAAARAATLTADPVAFHRALAEGVGMARLLDRLASYFGPLERCRALDSAPEPGAGAALRQDVLDRIAAGDGAGAAAAMQALLADDLAPLARWRATCPALFGEV